MRERTKGLAYDIIPPDHGCEHSPSCLTCPLEVCKHDLPKEQNYRKSTYTERVLERIAAGMPKEAIAEDLGITLRTVFRVIQKHKEATSA